MKTQEERVLRFLKDAGPSGVDQGELYNPPDNLPPISRLAARIHKLRVAGEPITSKRQLDRKYTRYFYDPSKSETARIEENGQTAFL